MVLPQSLMIFCESPERLGHGDASPFQLEIRISRASPRQADGKGSPGRGLPFVKPGGGEKGLHPRKVFRGVNARLRR
jgi:hypothetical protein